jgi:nucleotide-binding universal stress UspA family protein
MSAVVVPIVPRVEIKRILYATDFSPASRAALPIVCALARRYQSRIFLENVRSPLPYAVAAPEAACLAENQRERQTRAEMDKILQSEEMKGLAATVLVRSGDPAEELQRAVRDYDIDLAVVGTHGRTGLMRLLMGSLAEELFRNLTCPVLTVGPRLATRFQHPEGIKSFVCATDLSPESHIVFPLVASLAAEYRARIVLVHVIPSQEALSSKGMELAATRRTEIKRMFCGDVDPRCGFEVVVDFGEPAERILNCAQEHQADLIAFGVRQAGDTTTHFRHTVAYKVALESECPVLTQRSSKKWNASWTANERNL